MEYGTRLLIGCGSVFALLSMAGAEPVDEVAGSRRTFEEAEAGAWKVVFQDPCKESWRERWFLDGEIGVVESGPEGMTLTAGPEFRNDAHHMVLWTKESFEGDLKIEYEYTRLDKERRCVTILYVQATGSGVGPHVADIFKWNDLRRVPSMKTYYNHMHTYHISYAAFGNDGKDETGYIRGRRYMPEGKGLKGTELKPDFRPPGLFETEVKHHITVIKKDRDLYMKVRNPDQVFYAHMRNGDLPAIREGRVGLRHMFTRSARYRNFVISKPVR